MDNLALVHDSIFNLAYSCVHEIDYMVMKDKKNMFIISVIEEARLKTFLTGLLEINPDIKLTVLVQEYVFDGFKQNFGNRCNIISWHGGYSLKMLQQISELFDLDSIDSFVFFSDFSVNLRDMNFMEIAEYLNQKNGADTYCCTIGNDLFEYQNYPLYRQSLKVYEDMSELVGMYLDSVKS